MDCKQAVYSQEYYDLIVEYNGRPEAAQSTECTQLINNRYLVGYWPRVGQPAFRVSNYTYTAIPKLFTTVDQIAMEASGILQIQNQPTLSLRGNGVLVGIVDTGIDYQNPLFQNSDGTTRIQAIWDQTQEEGPAPNGFLYGREYSSQEIDEALASENPLEIVPSTDEEGHGTYVASLAAGGLGQENQFTGAAPYASLAVVKLKQAKDFLREYFFVAPDTLAFQENDIMAGIAYLDELAYQLDMPLVLCIALGSNWGNRSGGGPLSNVLDWAVSRRLRAGVIAAGNEANQRHHYQGYLPENGSSENVEINVGANVPGFYMELWSPVSESFSLEIISPTGERAPLLSPQTITREYTFLFEDTQVTVEKNITFASNDFQVIILRFQRPVQGIWIVRPYAENVLYGYYDMWLPMTELQQGEVVFLRSNPDMTITVPGAAALPLTVGGYNARDNSIYLDSGRGYALSGRVKPDLVAPGVEVLGAALNNGFRTGTGTCASAAITTGAIALLLEWAVVQGKYPGITSGDIKSILIRGADRDSQRTYPNRESGYGQLDLYQSFSSLRTP